MVTVRVIAAVGLVIGFFCLFNISFADFTSGIFGRLTSGPKGIRGELLENAKKKKKSLMRREIEDIQLILHETGREDRFPFLCLISMMLFAGGAVFAGLIGNFFMVPVLAVGMMFIPFWYIKLTAYNFKKNVAQELETALSIVTSAYIRTEDILTSVEESLNHLNPPIRNTFMDFCTRVKLVDPDIPSALMDMKGKIRNDVFNEWVDALLACQDDRSLKATLGPIVSKLSDMRIVNGELEYMISAPRKEFITMVVLVLSNIPLLYFLNKDWYNTLMHTAVGQIVLAICAAAIFICSACVIKVTKPVEYRS